MKDKDYEKIKNHGILCFELLILINAILLIFQTNTSIKQSAEIEMLKQNNIEQAEEKEYYINRYKELEEMVEEDKAYV